MSSKSPFTGSSGEFFVAVALLLGPTVPGMSQEPEKEVATLDEIVVTAQKWEEDLQEVPVSVTVFSGEEIRKRGAVRIGDLARSVPNMVITGAAENQGIDITIRGIRNTAFNAGFESSLGMYLDGVYLGRPFAFNQDLADIERIEILRGPQGTLFGKNTISGAINIVTRKPSDQFSVSGSVIAGTYSRFQGFTSVNVPISGSTFVKSTIFGNWRNGYYDNSHGPDLDDEGSTGGRLQVRTVSSDRLTIDFAVDAIDEHRNILFGETADTQPPPFTSLPRVGRFTVDPNFQPYEERLLRGAGLTVNYAYPSGFEVVSISAYRDADTVTTNDSDTTSRNLVDSLQAYKQNQISQEIRLQSPENRPLAFLTGLYYYKQDLDQHWQDFFRDEFLEDFAPLDPSTRIFDGEVITSNYAAYINASWHAAEALEIFGGLRYDYEEKDFAYVQHGIEMIGDISVPLTHDRHEEDNFTPVAGVNYSLTDRVLAYVKFSKAFKSGGWNAEIIPDDDRAFESEYVESYEVGIKSEWWSNRVRANLAVFRLDYEDMQIATFNPVTFGTKIENAGRARSEGVELELELAPTERLYLSAAYGYADARFVDFLTSGGNLAGTTLPSGVKDTISATGEYYWPIRIGSLIARLEYSYRGQDLAGPRLSDPLLIEEVNEGTTLVNARLGVESESGVWAAYVWGKNILDEVYPTSARGGFLGINQSTWGPPEEYGAQFTFRF